MSRCVLPFISFDYQYVSPCCKLQKYNDLTDRNKLINDHKANIKSKFCTSCWQTEGTGVESKRQAYNKLYSKYKNINERNLKHLVIPVGNVCNLACVTCGPFASTGWIKKSQFMQRDDVDVKVIQGIKNVEQQKLDNVEHIEFIGGETLKSASFWNYLKTFPKHINFSIQTNGTIILDKNQIDLLNSFENFNICFSIDGYGKIFEYLRQPAKWDSTVRNLKKYVQHFGLNKLSYLITISNLNILYIDKIVMELYKAVPCKFDFTLVDSPDIFAIDNLTPNIGKIIEQNNPMFFKKRKIKWSGTKKNLQDTLFNLEKQDEFSKLKFNKHLPDLAELIL